MDTKTNNEIILQGNFTAIPKFSHELFGIKFYEGHFLVNRLSNVKDELIIILSDKWMDLNLLTKESLLQIKGQVRSYNEIRKPKNKLLLRVFAKEICIPKAKAIEPNQVSLTGYLCKEPNYRTTPFGREISDLLVAVNRAHQKTDYIPVIAWGNYAKMIKDYEVGMKVQITGRLQSRAYQKVLPSGETVEKVVYEISSSQISTLPQEEDLKNEEMMMS